MDESLHRTIGGVALSMLAVGVGIALVAVSTGAWISATIVPELGAAEREVVTSYTPLAFLSITALAAPVVAGVLGVVKSDVVETNGDAAVVGVACLVGATLMVTVAGAGIAFSEPTAPDVVDSDGNGEDSSADGADDGDDTTGTDDGNDSDDDGTPGLLDLVGLAGLCGVGALVSGSATARLGA